MILHSVGWCACAAVHKSPAHGAAGWGRVMNVAYRNGFAIIPYAPGCGEICLHSM